MAKGEIREIPSVRGFNVLLLSLRCWGSCTRTSERSLDAKGILQLTANK